MSSTRQLILEAVRARAVAISVAGGYNTNAGASVLLGELPTFGPDDPDVAIAILADDDQVKWQGEKVFINLPLLVCVIARADLEEPWIAVEQALQDVKRAIELEDRTLGSLVKGEIERGSTKTLPREAGTEVVGAAISYVAPYVELWGRP